MKSHPDVAKGLAAKVVTQLPAPAQLGLLRFERLNQASWNMLSLDPICEDIFGLTAEQLCTLLDAPYLSLIEADNHQQLHADIQQQLEHDQYYKLQYYLHTPKGRLEVLEIGEAFEQDQLQMLRGYLLPMPPAAAISHTQPICSNDLFEQQRRVRAQRKLIVELSRQQYSSTNPVREAGEWICKCACELYDVSRVGIWSLSGKSLQGVNLYERETGQHTVQSELDLSQFPNYLESIHSGRSLDAHDALQDLRSCELSESYLLPLGITSLLDGSIRMDGQVVGVLSLEHIGPARQWLSDEITFVGELADQYAQVLSNHQRRSATDALYLFQRAVEQSSSAFILFNSDGLVEYVSPSFTTITQYSAGEVQGRSLADIPALKDLNDRLFEASTNLLEHRRWQGELKSLRKNNEPYWGHLSLSRVNDDDGKLSHFIGIYQDITTNKQTQQHIEQLAFNDTLTGLPNRNAFIATLEKHYRDNPSHAVCLLLVDIDNFKRVNDSLGHHVGDRLLISLARRLRHSLPASSVLARFASNEFAILISNKQHDSLQIADKLLHILDKPLFIDNQLINLTGSIGLACAPSHGNDPQSLMKHAGLALHKAKANGKNQLQIYNDALKDEAHYKLFVESNLRRALTQNQLEIFYQPKLCLSNGALVGMEALLRWKHPEQGMIAPDKFISVAEDTGLIMPIGKWVTRQACRMAKELSSLGLGNLQMAINLSPKQFSDPNLLSEIASIIDEEQLSPALLEFELTESLLIDASEHTRRLLLELKQLGVSLAMDDFGTGYSSLSYLKKFPIDVIKIDRSFIKDIPSNPDDMEITSAVIAMAHKLNLQVVAEGVETLAQLQFLRRQNCDIGQGYLFDKPIAGRDLVERLKRYPRRR
ncbi:putative bifunctional diguanylate cyclase/phosphodiesterase [Pseudomonas sp. 5P_3.1_Bac2]|uniref:putative bifunctional diguanylate cyclase/phosphodiesterase n=1 Tax=Pseudomonas sp. 5P_3.1_Bac2 TaxID=2971617 RepID=UPI0021C64643|nr:GGDEF and EAL domain-containing protein [Pseudomonas sp. 5P_3.1_Bac2]MCU1718354.1 EAL domain-containing protein [Pseudomonas sp. 5P_3.1_Bac2]